MNPLRIEYWPAERLKPYAGNPRKNDKAVDQMRASIREYGFAVPVLAVAATSEVVDGHLRLKGALAEGLTQIPVIPCDGWSEAQIRAFRLMANRSVSWAEWDPQLLKVEFDALQATGFDVKLTGFEQREIDGFAVTSDPAENEIPPLPADTTSRPDDLWLLGSHRLVCGDCTDSDTVTRLMGSERAGLMATDPPYGVNYENDERPNPGVAKPRVAKPRVANDQFVDGALQTFLESCFRVASFALKKNAAWYLWHAHLTQGFFAAAAAAAAHVILHRQIIWVKPGLLLGRGMFHWKHEPCFMGWVAGHRPPDYGERNHTTVWEVSSVSNEDRRLFNHSTPKPVELFRRPILKHLQTGEIAFEPFAGTGPQFIAAELTRRRCFGLELEPAFVDVIVTRWQNLTQREAVLEGDGRSFAAVKSARFLDQLGAQDEIKEHVEELTA